MRIFVGRKVNTYMYIVHRLLLAKKADHFPADFMDEFVLFRLTTNKATLMARDETAPIIMIKLALHVK